MQIPEQGLSTDQIFQQLAAFGEHDASWEDGHALAYVYHASAEASRVAERAYQMYLWENALDPTVFPSTMTLETQVVAMAAAHLRGDDQVVGNFTSGGTESVLLAVKTARDYARACRPGLGRPQMVLASTAHPCFFKAAHYFEVEPVVVPVDPRSCRADVEAMAAAITGDTVLLVGSAPSYAHGVVDPIAELGALALERGILLHVDGCIGAFLLPFFRELGAPTTDFDFTVPGVTSISMDLHKYAYCPKGASVILYRNADIRRHQIFAYSAWPGYSLVNSTVQSSKSCGPMAAAWAVLHHFGREGYTAIARGLIETRERVMAGLADSDDFHLLGQPEMTLFAIGSHTVNLFTLCDEMKRRGWLLHPQLALGPLEPSLHINLTPTNHDHIDGWLAALADAARTVEAAAPPAALVELKQALEHLDLANLDDRGIQMLLTMAGLGGGALPGDDLGEVWAILNDIEPAVRDRVLTLYWNDLNRYRG